MKTLIEVMGYWAFHLDIKKSCLCGPVSVVQRSLTHDIENEIVRNAGMVNPNLCSVAEE